MKNVFSACKKPLAGVMLLAGLGVSQGSVACGGFFCEFVPIDQAGEQIVFRQEGDQTTAMIKIDYVGNAEDFGWVLPVPQTPELSLGSDQIFTELELNTRPQFLLERVGSGCAEPAMFTAEGNVALTGGAVIDTADGVVIEQTLSIGAFDAQIVSSDDPEALASWLDENNLDLTDKGGELLAPYITSGSKFVVLKLKNNANVGSIQPIILKYQSSTPVIPMTLTAVAAQEDMGVLVWLLGNGRGVPENFKHVTPNYTRLNWFSGTRSAYASYQTLVTEAMNEAGGQGFATDFAGYLPNLPEQFSNSDFLEGVLTEVASYSDANFISAIWSQVESDILQSAIRTALPTSDAFVYARPLVMEEVFTAQQLADARNTIASVMQEQLIEPLNNAVDLLDDNLYLTRLYTTLSADEMNVNPAFTFNPQMEGQPLTRNATLTAECKDDGSHWTLKLGEGTGRDDEVVVQGEGIAVPFRAVNNLIGQDAVWNVERTSATASPVLLAQNSFPVAVLNSSSVASSSSSSGSIAPSTPTTGTTSSGGKKSGGLLDAFFLSLLGGILGLSGLFKGNRKTTGC